MKKLLILALMVMMMAFASAVQAEVRAGAFSFGLNGGYYLFEGNQDYKDNYSLGLRAGYNFTDNFGAEVFGNWVPSKYENVKGEADNKVYIAGVECLYHFMPGSSFVPFLAIGVGAIHYSSGDTELVPSKVTVDYGAGVKYFVTDNFSLRADVRHVLPLGDKEEYGDNPNFVHNDLLATLGISYDFGGEKKETIEAKVEAKVEAPPAPVEVVADSDKDGVADNLDKCPDTPSGAAIDKDGCTLDSDLDGVPDYLDKCPDVPRGIAGTIDGCPALQLPQPLPTPPPPPVVEEKKVVKAKVSMTINVEFDTAKADIKKKYHNEIKKVSDFMMTHPESNTVIEGHTDNVDIHNEPERNMRLSQARADSVRKYLVDEFGINTARISAVGYGPKKPIASNDTAEGRKKNRRVEAVIGYHALPSAPPPPVVEEKKVAKAKVSMILNVAFDTAKADIKKKYHGEIKKVSDFMTTHPEATAVIAGHTDNVDIHNEPERNMRLSQARADSVRKYLIDEFGIDAARISAVGYGPKKPIAGNDTEEGRKKNRRVEAVIETIKTVK